MPLDDVQRKRVEEEARKRGVDPAKAVAEAERVANGASDTKPSSSNKPPAADKPPDQGEGDNAASGGNEHPVADRLLIGYLPFIKVRELRSIWLGLHERIPDDEMVCGDFAAIHGGGTAPTGTPTE